MGDDTDILLLLCIIFTLLWQISFCFLFASKRSKSGQKIVCLKNTIDVTDAYIKENIIFAHSWSGCDTTSSTHEHGKSTILKYLKGKNEIQEISQTFTDSSASNLQILKAEIRLFLLLYGAKQRMYYIHNIELFIKKLSKTGQVTSNRISCWISQFTSTLSNS